MNLYNKYNLQEMRNSLLNKLDYMSIMSLMNTLCEIFESLEVSTLNLESNEIIVKEYENIDIHFICYKNKIMWYSKIKEKNMCIVAGKIEEHITNSKESLENKIIKICRKSLQRNNQL